MSVNSSMSTSVSGLEAHSQMLSVISDNIVNANTVGFKSSRGEFQSILAQDLLSSSGLQMGRGVSMDATTLLFSQGAITKTSRGTDLAINGNGFFTMKSDTRGMTFTRDGSFRFDKDGWLTNINGHRVQAYQSTYDGKITGKMGDVRIPFNTIPAKPTNRIQVHFNLDARVPPTAPLEDINKANELSQFSSAIQIFDSIGNAHSVGMHFNKVDDSTWEFYATTDGANLLGGTPGENVAVANGTLFFDPEGRLENVDQTLLDTTFANGAVPDQQLYFDFGDPLLNGGTGQTGTTQYGSKHVMFRNVQDGFGAGVLADTSIDADGIITGIYTNGQVKVLGQLAVARFEATERLTKLGENQFRESVQSGTPLIGRPNTNGRGTVMASSLENSNVDLAKEFVDMIHAQRGFQASAKSITTANEMLDEVVKLV